MKQKYFLFDIGNVLFNFDFDLLMSRIATDSGRPAEPYTEPDWVAYDAVEKGNLTDQEFVDYLNQAKGLSWTVESYTELWREMFSLNPEGQRHFQEAIQNGTNVYTLSNIAGHHVDAIERIVPDFFKRPTGLFLSYEMGVRKPDPKIYRIALETLGVEGSQCFFIDDMAENIEAAQTFGIEAHHFVPENYEKIREAVDRFFASSPA